MSIILKKLCKCKNCNTFHKTKDLKEICKMFPLWRRIYQNQIQIQNKYIISYNELIRFNKDRINKYDLFGLNEHLEEIQEIPWHVSKKEMVLFFVSQRINQTWRPTHFLKKYGYKPARYCRFKFWINGFKKSEMGENEIFLYIKTEVLPKKFRFTNIVKVDKTKILSELPLYDKEYHYFEEIHGGHHINEECLIVKLSTTDKIIDLNLQNGDIIIVSKTISDSNQLKHLFSK